MYYILDCIFALTNDLGGGGGGFKEMGVYYFSSSLI